MPRSSHNLTSVKKSTFDGLVALYFPNFLTKLSILNTQNPIQSILEDADIARVKQEKDVSNC
jgi:hypothetical protein